MAATLTVRDEDDASQVGPLLDQVADPVASFTADGAYDQDRVYADVAEATRTRTTVYPPLPATGHRRAAPTPKPRWR